MPHKAELVWCKKPTFSAGRTDYASQHEPILYGWKKTHRFHGIGKWQTTLWHYSPQLKNKLHPTQKPPELIKNAIENSMEPLEKAEGALLNSSVKNDLILDPFAGSGSVLIAAEDCKRLARLIEIDPGYCDVIVRRALDAFPEMIAYRERGGESFEVTADDFSD
jgi:DNA modification methylase